MDRSTYSWYQSFKYWKKRRLSKFRGKRIEDTFKEIHEKNFWNSADSVSGIGSDNSQTETVVKELPEIFEKYNKESMLDIPCGDFNWMRNVNLNGINYVGADIVADLVVANQKSNNSELISFELLNLVEDALPKVDLILSRDCLVHFSYDDIRKALANIISSGSKYLLTTSFVDRERNYNIATGEWRPINLNIAPFNFPESEMVLNENCTQDDGAFPDKSLMLWKIEDLSLTNFS